MTLKEGHPSYTADVEHYLQAMLQIHQTLALVDVDYSQLSNAKEHLNAILKQL